MPRPVDKPAASATSLPLWRISFLMVVLIGALLLYERRQRGVQGPLTYRIGTVDSRFGLSREEFSGAVAQAASLWKQAVSRDVFRADAKGVMEINLVYDYRQEAADRMKGLSFKIENTKGSYDQLKAHFETLKRESDLKSSGLTQDFADHNSRVATFNRQVETARQRGGVEEATARQLEAEQRQLSTQKEDLVRRQEELKTSVETLRSMTVVINEIASNHNLDLVNYRDTGSQLGPEFSEGIYEQKGTRRTITIYHFPSHDGLVRALAHEMGHAKGLPHLDNPQAVMHRLMVTERPELTPDDVAALKAKLAK